MISPKFEFTLNTYLFAFVCFCLESIISKDYITHQLTLYVEQFETTRHSSLEDLLRIIFLADILHERDVFSTICGEDVLSLRGISNVLVWMICS